MTDLPLGPHFLRSEFVCRHCGALPDHILPNVRYLVAILENIRAQKGNRPLTIVSAYRCSAHNAAVGGARNSQHLYGRAADLSTSVGLTLGEAHAAGAAGIGLSGSRVRHVDWRPGVAGPVTWTYS